MRNSRNRFPQQQLPAPHSRALYEQYRVQSSIALAMRNRGLHIDQAAVRKHIQETNDRRHKFANLWKDITGVAELGANGLTAEIKNWFWGIKGIPETTTVKDGKPTLDTNGFLMWCLEDSGDEEIQNAAAALIGYRKASKALSMLVAYDVPKIYPEWNVTGTKGSRWSSSGPNLMNMPSKDVKYAFPHGVELVAANYKNIIIPRPGYVFVSADWSALELYLQTYIAQAKQLMSWIDSGEDLHMNNARIFFGDALPATATKKTHKAYREVGKLAFGFSYNVSDHIASVHKQMRGKLPTLTMDWVKEARLRYFSLHHEFPTWQRKTMEQISSKGFIELGLMKRRLYLEASTRGYNQAMNSQCQTLGGDLMVAAVISLAQTRDIALTWYDNITMEIVDDKIAIQEAGQQLANAMAGPFNINGIAAKFVAEAAVGPNLRDDVPL